MCGIVGYVGRGQALPVLLEGLRRLEYRGYDSAGVAVRGDALAVRKSLGRLTELEARLEREPAPGSLGIAHTRWATHGEPSETNSHPHTGAEVANDRQVIGFDTRVVAVQHARQHVVEVELDAPQAPGP